MNQIRGTVNRIELIGWVGDAPEHRLLASGAAVVNFRLATKRFGPKNEAGERTYETDWTTIEAWDRLATQVANYLHKGSRVRVAGSLHTHQWEDKESGQRRYKTFVRADEVLFLDARVDANGQEPAEVIDETEDIPF
ncbi:MAG TPA: single-stranded DNA-binding protein [Roseiflexaceae bacterium]|nr:single-stranded DNA-binding protein [Roseiflexaceae bacterium]